MSVIGIPKSMKHFLIRDGKRHKLTLDFPEASFARVADEKCPHCGSEQFGVAGTGKRPSKDDRAWEADAVSTCCKKPVGTIRVETGTLFGVREDAEVLSGRYGRVY